MAKSKPKQKKRRIWRTLLISVFGLGVFLLMFVAAFIFNPFEGSLPELRDIVPRGVNFFVRKQNLAEDFDPFPEPRFWQALLNSEGYGEFQDAGGGLSSDDVDGYIDQAREQFDEISTQTNGVIDVMRDLIGTEVIFAGTNMDYSVVPARLLAEPRWCLYTRVGWRAKAALGLMGFGYVQGMAEENGVKVTSQDDLLVITLPNQPPLYIKRHKDAVMVSNYTGLLDQAQRLIDGSRDEQPIGQQPAYTDGAEKRIMQWAEDNAVSAPNVIEYLIEPNAFDGFRRKAASWPDPQNRDSMNERVLASFLNLKGWMQVAGGIMFEGNVLGATGLIGLNSKQHTAFQSSFYTAEKQRRSQWLDPFLKLVPASACAAAALRMPAGEFLHAMFDALEVDEKSLINDALRRATFNGEQVQDVRDLVDRLRLAFKPRTGFVFRRNIPDTSIDKETGELMIPVTAKSPMPQVAWVFWLRPNGAPLVESLVSMLSNYHKSFGFQRVWHLPVPFGDRKLDEPVTEFTNPQIPATGTIAMLVFREFFIVSNSGPLIRDILLTKYSSITNAKSIRDLPEFAELESELSQSLSGLVWINGANMVPVLDDYLNFADQSSEMADQGWMRQMRATAEEEVRRKYYPRYPSIASLPDTLTRQGGEFDQRVRSWLDSRWAKERSNFTEDDRKTLLRFRGMAKMLRVAAIQVELENSYIRYQARIMTNLK